MSGGRVVYVHALAPPRGGGTASVVRRVLSGLPDVELEVLTDVSARPLVESPRALPGKYRFFLKLPTVPVGYRGAELANAAIGSLNVVLALAAGLRAGWLAGRGRPPHVLSVLDDGFSVIAGGVGARLAGVPHLIWAFDLWEENAYPRFNRWLGGRVERALLRHADAVIVHADEMARHYRAKHGIECQVLPTPVQAEPGRAATEPNGDRPKEVLVSGALYWAQEDAVRRLARVCDRLPGVQLTLLVPDGLMKVEGAGAAKLERGLTEDRVPGRLGNADVLFLGLGFDTDHPEIIRTATPARLPEYMASGVPIVVHAPPGSHVAEYARAEGFATVVDTPDEAALERALETALSTPEPERAARARELVELRHDAGLVRQEFLRILDATCSRPDA